MSLVPRFYDVLSGGVSISGRDIRDIQIKSLRDHIGLVSQETVLFHGTIAENIAYGKHDISFDKIKELIKDDRRQLFSDRKYFII